MSEYVYALFDISTTEDHNVNPVLGIFSTLEKAEECKQKIMDEYPEPGWTVSSDNEDAHINRSTFLEIIQYPLDYQYKEPTVSYDYYD